MAEPAPHRIDLRLREARQLFNSLDPAPFYERDLDPDAETYILACARGTPHGRPTRIVVHLATDALEESTRREIREAIRAFFEREAVAAHARLATLLAQGRRFLAIGLAFLVGSIGLAELLSHLAPYPFVGILREGLVIAGWVAMWRPMETFLYGWWPVRDEERMHRTLAAAEIEVVADGARGPGPTRPAGTSASPP